MKIYYKAIVIFISAASVAVFGIYINDRRQSSAFLSNLQGEIVFNRRDGSNLNIYTISADGKNEKLVFANNDQVNSNSLSPRWSDDGLKIRFTAMKNGKWQTFVVDPNGSNLQIFEPESDPLAPRTPPDDIKIERGSIYTKEGDGRETLVYEFAPLLGYDHVFCSGAHEATWSPDKQYIVFETSCYGSSKVMIADRNGKSAVSLTGGRSPAWK